MKRFAVLIFLAGLTLLGVTLVGCGANSSTPANINGTWNATLVDTNNGPTLFDFGTSLVVSGNGTLSVTNFQFSSNNEACFQSGATETGSFTLSGNFNGQVTGSFGFTVQSSSADSTLSLSGTATGNTISGTWKLTGATGCTGNGTFTMTRM